MKQIGIPGWVNQNMFGITRPYAEFINKYGNLVILSPNDTIRKDLDLLILPGGADIAPSRYVNKNNDVSFYTGASNPLLEIFDDHKLPEYIKNKTPILSICRGSQSLWSMFGGKLIQHNFTHEQSTHDKDECHGLYWTKGNFEKYGHLIEKVNSRHHQTMDSRFTPKDIEVLALAKESDGTVHEDIVEIFRHKKLPIFGYQGHPEDMLNDNLTDMIISEFLDLEK